MLHIAWMTFKFLGSFILVLLGILLFLLLAGLFVPLRYRISLKKHEKNWRVEGRISWLFRAVSVAVSYEGKKPFCECYILGIPMLRIKKGRDAKRGGAQKAQRRREEEGHPYRRLAGKRGAGGSGQDPVRECPAAEFGKSPGEKKKSIYSRMMDKIRILVSIPQRIYAALKENYGKFRYWKSILQSDDIQYLKTQGFRRVRTFWKHVRPRKIRGDLTFGFEDPAHTGEVLGLLAVLYPFFPRRLSMTPMFAEHILEGRVEMRGRVYGVYCLTIALQILFDGRTIPIIKKFMCKEA